MGWNGIYHYNQELKLSIFNQGMFLEYVFLDVMLYGVQNIHVKYSYQMFYLGLITPIGLTSLYLQEIQKKI